MPRHTVSKREPKSVAPAATTLALTVIAFGAVIMFWPGIRGNASYLVSQRRPLTSVADGLAANASLRFTPFVLRPKQRACMNSITITASSRIALFQLFPLSTEQQPTEQGRPAVELLLSALNYRSVSKLAAGHYTRRLQFHMQPPTHSLIGNACLLNRGPVVLTLEGTTDPRTTSRSALTIDGRPAAGNLTLSFFAGRSIWQAENLGQIFGHISNLTDQLVPVWLIWIVAVSALLGVPIGTVIAFHRALRDPEALQ